MLLASTGATIVLYVKVLSCSGCSAHSAMPSSPVFRMKLFVAVEFVTPRWKLMPSAVWSRIRLFSMVRWSIGPSIQAPTLVCWIQTESIVESLIAPPKPLTWSESLRSLTSPKIARFDTVTSWLPPADASLP